LDLSKVKILLTGVKEFDQVSAVTRNVEERHKVLGLLTTEQSARKIFYSIVTDAVRRGASDIHIEADGDEKYKVRFRNDGEMQHRHTLSTKHSPPLFVVMKADAKLEVEERRRPQGGRIHFDIDRIKAEPLFDGLDLRVSTMPTVMGQKCVLRLLHSAS